MPLVQICGLPNCGKTYVANCIKEFLEQKQVSVFLINEESLNINKKEGYSSSSQEKTTRSMLKSTLEREIRADKFVIFDSLNYVKGFRYEIYCLARAIKTQYCLVYVDIPPQSIKQSEGNQFTEEQIQSISQRFEMPVAKNKWEKPLISVRNLTEIPFDAIEREL